MNEPGSISWDITTEEGMRFPFGFDSFITSPVERMGPGLSAIKEEVNFVNSSFIISTVTFLRASKLHGTIISCDEWTIIFAVSPSTGVVACV